MKAYKKLQTRYHEKVKAKWRARIKCFVISFLILFTVASFTGLVIGLSLGTASPAKCNYYSPSVQYCSPDGCVDTSNNTDNCAYCGGKCAFDASCVKSKCAFCAGNCSNDGFFCTVPPCNTSTGCSIFDCSNDGNPCTVNPCNNTINNCTFLDCENDNNFCTVGTCNPLQGGCAIRNCSATGNPCFANPCVGGACAYQCPVLQLNPPLVNISSTISGSVSSVPITPGLILYSIPEVTSANVTIVGNPPVGSVLAATLPLPSGWTATYTQPTLNIVSPSASQASSYANILRGVTYSASITTFPTTVIFSFQIMNAKFLLIPSPVDAFITFTGS